jgi:hypothetical protein
MLHSRCVSHMQSTLGVDKGAYFKPLLWRVFTYGNVNM